MVAKQLNDQRFLMGQAKQVYCHFSHKHTAHSGTMMKQKEQSRNRLHKSRLDKERDCRKNPRATIKQEKTFSVVIRVHTTSPEP